MPRTTLNLDDSVLRELRRRSELEGKSLGQLASEYLAQALARTRAERAEPQPLAWPVSDMRARVDIDDRDAVQELLDRG